MSPRILVVEDESTVARLVVLGLQRLVPGSTVEVAEHGGVALERLAGSAPWDLLVCDIMMPVMDGARLIEALGDLDRPPRVLVLSAVPERELADVLRRPQVSGYLQKPVDLLVLAERVRELLG